MQVRVGTGTWSREELSKRSASARTRGDLIDRGGQWLEQRLRVQDKCGEGRRHSSVPVLWALERTPRSLGFILLGVGSR